jgi:hypothetical protein
MGKVLCLALLVSFFIISCKKDKQEDLPIVVGYWKGGTGMGPEIRMLHHADGKGKLYYFIPTDPRDTANATFKLDGLWQISGNNYTSIYLGPNGSSLKFSAVLDVPTLSINGPLLIQSSTQTVNTVFSMLKQL